MPRKFLAAALLCGMALFMGCEKEDEEIQAEDSTLSPIDLSKVVWLHSNVSEWEETAVLSSVSIGGGTITLDFDKADVWPGKTIQEVKLNGNPWVIVKINDVWYAGTWEWLKVGQKTKAAYAVAGDHIKMSPLGSWKPTSGTEYGFMVSGLARTGTRNVLERSNVVMKEWP